jgi:hypothetical protein
MARGPHRVGWRPRPLGVPRGTLLNIFAPRADGTLAPIHTWTAGCGRPAMSHGCRACCRLSTWVAGSWTLTGEVQVRADGHLAQSESSGPVAPAGGCPRRSRRTGPTAKSGHSRNRLHATRVARTLPALSSRAVLAPPAFLLLASERTGGSGARFATETAHSRTGRSVAAAAAGGCGWAAGAGEIACSGRDRPAHQSISTGSVKVDGRRAPGAGATGDGRRATATLPGNRRRP